jgi:hypothetical protein
MNFGVQAMNIYGPAMNIVVHTIANTGQTMTKCGPAINFGVQMINFAGQTIIFFKQVMNF